MIRLVSISCSLFLGLAALAFMAGHTVSAHSILRPAHAMSGGSMGMGPSTMVKQMAWMGYYDSHLDTYLNTDVSTKAQASSMHVNYSAALAGMHGAPAIYLVQGMAAAHQLAVFGSQPGEVDYSPLWQEVNVSWKAGARAVLLTSDNQIKALVKKGKLATHATGVVLNCPIIKVGK